MKPYAARRAGDVIAGHYTSYLQDDGKAGKRLQLLWSRSAEILHSLSEMIWWHTFTDTMLVSKNGTFLDLTKGLEHFSHIIFIVLFVQHTNKQLPLWNGKRTVVVRQIPWKSPGPMSQLMTIDGDQPETDSVATWHASIIRESGIKWATLLFGFVGVKGKWLTDSWCLLQQFSFYEHYRIKYFWNKSSGNILKWHHA